jgi:hypothetical protein
MPINSDLSRDEACAALHAWRMANPLIASFWGRAAPDTSPETLTTNPEQETAKMAVNITFDYNDPADVQLVRKIVGAPSAGAQAHVPEPVHAAAQPRPSDTAPIVPVANPAAASLNGAHGTPPPLVPEPVAAVTTSPAEIAAAPVADTQAGTAAAAFAAAGKATKTVTSSTGDALAVGAYATDATGERVMVLAGRRGYALVVGEDNHPREVTGKDLTPIPAVTIPAPATDPAPLVPVAAVTAPASSGVQTDHNRLKVVADGLVAAAANDPDARTAVIKRVQAFLAGYGVSRIDDLPEGVTEQMLSAAGNGAPAASANGW